MLPRPIRIKADDTFKAIERLQAELKVQHIRAFDAVYTPDGSVIETANGYDEHLPCYFLTATELKHIDEKNRDDATTLPPHLLQHDNVISRLTAFTGLKNRVEKGKVQSWLNIAKQFIGWQDDATPTRKIVNIVKSPLVLAWNILAKLIKQIKNIVRLATEFLPYLLYRYCMFGMEYAALNLEWKCLATPAQRFGFGLLYALALTGRILFGTIFFIGQAVTSPKKSFKTSWKAGHDLADRLFDSSNKTTRRVLGHIIGGVFAVMSLATTIAVYTFAMPLAIKALGSLVVTKMPGFLSSVMQTISNALYNVFSAVGNAVSLPLFGHIYAAMGVTVSAGASGCALIGNTISTVIGVAVDKIYTHVQNKRYANKSVDQSQKNIDLSPGQPGINNQKNMLKRLSEQPAYYGKVEAKWQPLPRRVSALDSTTLTFAIDIPGQRAFFEDQEPHQLPQPHVGERVYPRALSKGKYE